jgi:uncharacterized protein YecA (UPF0149 family)
VNTDTGQVATMDELTADLKRKGRRQSYIDTVLKPIDPANLSERNRAQLAATGRTQISRNSPCPCGSRKRFKRCCMTTGGAK